MTPPRIKGKPVFDPDALNDDLDQLWPGPKDPSPAPQQPAAASAVATKPPAAPAPARAAVTPVAAPVASVVPPAVKSPANPSTPASVGRRLRSVSSSSEAAAQPRYRPPEVSLSGEVYDALYSHQLAEKKTRRSLARTMGTIVLDAIQAHADRLQTAWVEEIDEVGEDSLFIRPASTVVPRRRRHAVPPRSVVLSGVTAANATRLDALVETWGAGTRSALVEQALRFEFGLV